MTLPLWTPPKKRGSGFVPIPPIEWVAPKPKEVLSGYVQGKAASDIEERSAYAITRAGFGYTFRARLVPIPRAAQPKQSKLQRRLSPQEEEEKRQYDIVTYLISTPGVLEVDFLVTWKGGKFLPILVDGQYSHFKSKGQADLDKAKQDAIDLALQSYNAFPVTRVSFDVLQTQTEADTYFKRLLA